MDLPDNYVTHIVKDNKYLGYNINSSSNKISEIYGKEIEYVHDCDEYLINKGLHYEIPIPIIYYDVHDGFYNDNMTSTGIYGYIKNKVKVGTWTNDTEKYTYENGQLIKYESRNYYIDTFKDGFVVTQEAIGDWKFSYNKGRFEGYQECDKDTKFNTKSINGVSKYYGRFEVVKQNKKHVGTLNGKVPVISMSNFLSKKGMDFIGEYTITSVITNKIICNKFYNSESKLEGFCKNNKVLFFYDNNIKMDISYVLNIINRICIGTYNIPEFISLLIDYL